MLKKVIRYQCESCKNIYDKHYFTIYNSECYSCTYDNRIKELFKNPNRNQDDLIKLCHKYDYGIKRTYNRAYELGLI